MAKMKLKRRVNVKVPTLFNFIRPSSRRCISSCTKVDSLSITSSLLASIETSII